MTDPAILKLYESIQSFTSLIQEGEQFMANMADLLAKLADLQTGQVELLKDVRRLIAAGDTSAALTAVDDLIAKNTELDAEVEAASAEPVEPPVEP